ncbi:MAG: hypothetical protein PVF17_02130 [Ignavibacteria bacterium]|jgi:hypothetical protein
MFIFLVLIVMLFNQSFAQDTESNNRMAEQMAEWMDVVWDQDPEEDYANIRILMTKDGEPFAGKISLQGDFNFRAEGRTNHYQAFNPNSNGRWVYQEIDPGTFNLTIEGSNEFEGFKWTKKSVKIEAGDKPLFEITLD